MSSGIYCITHTRSGKRYIGSSKRIEFRWKRHMTDLRCDAHHAIKLQRAWNKYGPDEFQFKVLLYCAESDLMWYEQQCIEKLSPEFNSAEVVDGRWTWGEKQRQAISIANKNRVITDETRQKLSEANKGHIVTEETRAKIRAGHAGKKLTHEHIEKIKENRKHQIFTDETRKKIGEATRLRYDKLREEYKQLPEDIKLQLKLDRQQRRRAASAKYRNSEKGRINIKKPETPEQRTKRLERSRSYKQRQKEKTAASKRRRCSSSDYCCYCCVTGRIIPLVTPTP